MRDIRVTDDILTGPATDELLDDVFFMRWVDDDLEPRPPDAIDRFLARQALADAEATASSDADSAARSASALPSAA